MFKYSLLLALCLLTSGSVLAQAATYTLFALDVSLSTDNKETAIDIVTEVTLTAPDTQSVGLTLFDDTVRGYIAPSPLDMQQIKSLNQTMAEAQDSVRSTSNLAVAIERAIDAFSPDERANLVVFSRGIIDTKTDDPRARFNEWLDLILLPQATENNIAITLVVPQTLEVSPPIKQAFEKSEFHQITTLESGASIPPELLSLLSITDRAYGAAELPDEVVAVAETDTTEDTTRQGSANQFATQSADATPQDSMDLPMMRLVLLALACTLLVGILIWRFFGRRASKGDGNASDHDDPTMRMQSSTYLPLTEKPSDTMDHWMEKETDLRIAESTKAKQSNSESQATAARSEPTQARQDSTVARGPGNKQ